MTHTYLPRPPAKSPLCIAVTMLAVPHLPGEPPGTSTAYVIVSAVREDDKPFEIVASLGAKSEVLKDLSALRSAGEYKCGQWRYIVPPPPPAPAAPAPHGLVEIVNPRGEVSYRRPDGHPDVEEALRAIRRKAISYTLRFEDGTPYPMEGGI